MQLVTYDESGTLVIKTPPNDHPELPPIDTSFSRSSAGGTTRQCALMAYSLMPHELSTILSLARQFTLVPDHEVVVPDKTTAGTDHEEHAVS